jgi:glycosyltransferase involved in cell wall biosynthesis
MTDGREVAAAAIWIEGDGSRFLPTLRSLKSAGVERVLVSGASLDAPTRVALVNAGAEEHVARDPQELLRDLFVDVAGHVALVLRPALVAPDAFSRACEVLDTDLRIATVSFPTNAGGIVSVPRPFEESAYAFRGHDEASATELLRRRQPPLEPVPLPHADGSIVVVSGDIGRALANEASSGPGASMWGVAADLSLQARRRGFLNVLDASTYIATPLDLGQASVDLTRDEDRAWIEDRHPFIGDLLAFERDATDSAMRLGLEAVRVAIEGATVLIDGTVLGPVEMGSQVALVRLIGALAGDPGIRRLAVVLPGPVPPYAEEILTHPKIEIVPPDLESVEKRCGRFDIGHRPFQPDGFDVDAWRQCCSRVVVSLLDLIAYQVGAYEPDGAHWVDYREDIRSVTGSADAVAAISADVRRHVEVERLPIDGSRLFVIPLGTEHLTGDEPRRPPAAFLDPALADRPFLLVLGTNYAHKNRDLAVRIRAALDEAGERLLLVLAGAAVSRGSSRVAEARALVGAGDDDVLVLPDVDSEERNWLLAHARLLLYPTSAEGFGFVPFEAARFGTPTVSVSFGSLRELGADGPVAPASWAVDDLAAAALELLRDPAKAQAQVESITAAGDRLTWQRCASAMLEMYRSVLDRPPRSPARMKHDD